MRPLIQINGKTKSGITKNNAPEKPMLILSAYSINVAGQKAFLRKKNLSRFEDILYL